METLTLLLMVTIVTGVSCATESRLAILHESEADSRTQRELTLLPDTINAELRLDGGDVISLRLERVQDIKVESPKVKVGEREYSGDHFIDRKRVIGYYHDVSKMAALTVEAKLEESSFKRVLTGSLVHNNRMYEVEPASDTIQGMSEILEKKGLGKDKKTHMVHELKEVDKKYLNVGKDTRKVVAVDRRIERLEKLLEKLNIKHRTKRQSLSAQTMFHVELMFVVDKSVYDYWYAQKGNDQALAIAEIQYYYTQVLNGMYMAYRSIQDPTFQVSLWLAELQILQTTELISGSTICDTAANFCKEEPALAAVENWIKTKGYNWTYPDHIAFFTKRDLKAVPPAFNVDLLGVASTAGVCSPGPNGYSGYSLNEDNGVISWHTAAHELGHNLGALHDTQDNSCTGIYIMAATDSVITQQNLNTAFTFSTCSVAEMKAVVTGQSSGFQGGIAWPRVCLYDTVCSHNTPLTNIDELPGQKYTKDQQCQIYTGDSRITENECSSINPDVCKHMYCHHPDFCPGSNQFKCCGILRAAPGTPCDAQNTNMVCYYGRCIDKNTITNTISNVNPSCSATQLTVPAGCADNPSEADCPTLPITHPWECFNSNYWKTACQASCYKYHLFNGDNPVCGSPITPAPAVTTTTTTTQPPTTTTTTQPPTTTTTTTQPPTTTTTTTTTTTQPPTTTTTTTPPPTTTTTTTQMPTTTTTTTQPPTTTTTTTQPPTTTTTTTQPPTTTTTTQRPTTTTTTQRPTTTTTTTTPLPTTTTTTKQPTTTTTTQSPAVKPIAGGVTLPFENCLPANPIRGYPGGVKCPNHPNVCINMKDVCDGFKDCPDNADEDINFCIKVPYPDSRLVRCRENPTRLVWLHWLGDGYPECSDDINTASDEDPSWMYNAPRYCYFKYYNDFQCRINGRCDKGINCPNNLTKCIRETDACDGYNDCNPQSGEAGDETPMFCKCGAHETKCLNQRHQCIGNFWVYDGENDCLSGSDEDYALARDWCDDLPPKKCGLGEVRCPACPSQCIPKHQKCDRKVYNCPDKSDEKTCYYYKNWFGSKKREMKWEKPSQKKVVEKNIGKSMKEQQNDPNIDAKDLPADIEKKYKQALKISKAKRNVM